MDYEFIYGAIFNFTKDGIIKPIESKIEKKETDIASNRNKNNNTQYTLMRGKSKEA